MKTAEEWINKFKENHLDGNDKYVNNTTKDIPDLIKQIQSDAWKQGMRDCIVSIENNLSNIRRANEIHNS